MIGQTLGHYKIVDKLGAGGMGDVCRAEDSTLKRQVALKVLPPDLAASQERLERFQREAESLAALNHPNIIHIYTVEEAEGVRFVTIELVEGKQLSALIPKGGRHHEDQLFSTSTDNSRLRRCLAQLRGRFTGPRLRARGERLGLFRQC